MNEAEDSIEGRHVRFEKWSDDVEVNGFSTLAKTSHKRHHVTDEGTYSGAGQDEKDEDHRLEFVVERNEDPNYFLH